MTVAQETAFRCLKSADSKRNQADASLIFGDKNKNIAVRIGDRDFVTIPYEQVHKFFCEYTKKHRITQGGVVMVASLGAGAIFMLTRSKEPLALRRLSRTECAEQRRAARI